MIKSGAWVDKFQPQTVSECILPAATRAKLEYVIKMEEVPSMFFCGPPGIGKTTVALAICRELDLEHMVINASLHGNIDTVRTDIASFAATISFNGKKKVIILDEADGLTAAAQASLRAAINEYTDNTAVILTANYRNKLIEPLISRLDEVDFLFDKSELPTLAVGLYSFITARLKEENVEYDPKAVQSFIRNRITKTSDIRKLLIDAQSIAKTKVFDAASIIDLDQERLQSMQDLINMISKRNFNSIRTWVSENSDIPLESVARYLYDNIQQLAKDANIPAIISIINTHQFQSAFVADQEINTASMLAELSMVIR
jgi:DNA polymerase III delta prime subunit